MSHDPQNRQPGKFERIVADLAGRRAVWIVLMAVSVGLPLAKAFTIKLPPAPVKIRQVPDFTLVNQDGNPFGVEQLRGKLWVADFIFTTCPTVCPRLTNALERVKLRSKNMKGAVQFISFSVDPGHDTPEVLSRFVDQRHARGGWNFLTGSVADMRSVVIDGFKLGMGTHADPAIIQEGGTPVNDSPLEGGKRNPAAELLSAAHGAQLVLVDKDMWIRGFYNPDPDGIDRLMFEMGLIANIEGVEVRSLDPTIPIKH